MIKDQEIDELKNIKENYCIGCGICSITNFAKINLDTYGKFKPDFSANKSEIQKILEICPFSSCSFNEDVLGKFLFTSEKFDYSSYIGYYLKNYIGHVKDDKIRLNSSSGGIITWLLSNLLKSGNINHAIHVTQSEKVPLLFEYTISNREKSIIKGASSRYYPVEMSSVLKFIEEHDGNYAVVALPCFTKGLRLLQQKNKVYSKRIKYIISPICGHLKTTNYAAFLAWQKGILPDKLMSINFRKKFPNKLASEYGTELIKNENNLQTTLIVSNSFFKMGTDWGHGMFKYPACDYCDDIVGELADISVGDAWLPKYISDYKGNSVIIVRNKKILEILNDKNTNNELNIESVSTDIVKQSQVGGFRHKRDDLKYRLWIKEQNNEWHPPKRVSATENSISPKRKQIIKMRLRISEYSHELFLEALNDNNIKRFFKKMNPILNHYYFLNFGLIRFLKHKIKQLL